MLNDVAILIQSVMLITVLLVWRPKSDPPTARVQTMLLLTIAVILFHISILLTQSHHDHQVGGTLAQETSST